MIRLLVALLLLLASACPATPPLDASPRSARFQTCSSSAECTHGTNGCTYCYQGACSCSLPAEPLPIDAGIDAASPNPSPR